MRACDLPPPPEHDEQAVVIEWWNLRCRRYKLPPFALFAIPNGGHRHPAVAGKLRAEGVRSGIPDLCLAAARSVWHGLYVEMKSLTGDAKPSQLEVGDFLRNQQYRFEVCRGATQAIKVIHEYLEGVP